MYGIRKLAMVASVGAAGMAVALGGTAQADEFPSKAITLIVPFGAGGGTDQWARAIATGAFDVTGQAMHVRNMPGASATVGWANLLDMPADGYTIMFASPTPMLAHMTQQRPPFQLDDIKIVAYIGAFDSVVATQDNLGWSDWDSFVEYARENPGTVTVGGTTSNIVGTATTFNSAGIEVVFVPYASTADATADFLGGHIDAVTGPTADIATFAPEYGIVIINASDLPFSDHFREAFGNPPLATDIGLEGVSLPRWVGVHPDTPDEIAAKLSDIIGELLEQPGVKGLLNAIDAEVIFTPFPQSQTTYEALVVNMREFADLLR